MADNKNFDRKTLEKALAELAVELLRPAGPWKS